MLFLNELLKKSFPTEKELNKIEELIQSGIVSKIQNKAEEEITIDYNGWNKFYESLEDIFLLSGFDGIFGELLANLAEEKLCLSAMIIYRYQISQYFMKTPFSAVTLNRDIGYTKSQNFHYSTIPITVNDELRWKIIMGVRHEAFNTIRATSLGPLVLLLFCLLIDNPNDRRKFTLDIKKQNYDMWNEIKICLERFGASNDRRYIRELISNY